MRVCILGPLELWQGGKELRLGGGRQRALLLVLVLHADEVVSTDRLIDALWPDTPPATAAKVVQTWISQLRKVLPAGVLVTQRSGYVLRGAESDAGDSERLAAAGAAALADGDAERAASLLSEALGLWRGDALAEFPFESYDRSTRPARTPSSSPRQASPRPHRRSPCSGPSSSPRRR